MSRIAGDGTTYRIFSTPEQFNSAWNALPQHDQVVCKCCSAAVLGWFCFQADGVHHLMIPESLRDASLAEIGISTEETIDASV